MAKVANPTALDLVEQILNMNPDRRTQIYANKMRQHLRLPMSDVMAHVPGKSIGDKINRLGISRACYYGWISGIYRPDKELSKVLSRITGYDEEDIRGRSVGHR